MPAQQQSDHDLSLIRFRLHLGMTLITALTVSSSIGFSVVLIAVKDVFSVFELCIIIAVFTIVIGLGWLAGFERYLEGLRRTRPSDKPRRHATIQSTGD